MFTMFTKLTHFAFQQQFRINLTKPVRCASHQAPMAGPLRYQYNENTIFVREAKDHRRNPVFSVAFTFKNRMPPMEKTYAFWLGLDEPIENTVQAIKRKIGNEIKIRIKLGMTDGATDDDLKALADGELNNFDIDILNENGESVHGVNWKEICLNDVGISPKIKMKIQQKYYAVAFNSPHISWVDLPATIMVGDDCYPIDLDLVNTSKDECTYKWYKGLPSIENVKDNSQIEWKLCNETFSYRVTADDVGYKLKIVCTPINGKQMGPTLSVISRNAVVEQFGGAFDAFGERQEYTSHKLPVDGNQFRVVSYNLLADFYNASKSSLSEWYPYCRPEALEIGYRKKLFIRELRGYNSDIICLQEIDSKIFHADLKIMMGEYGFDGALKRKGAMPEGLVTFFDTKKFSLIWTGGFTLGEYINGHPSMVEFYEQIKGNEALCNRLFNLPGALQLTLLKSNYHDKYILVANTHLCASRDAAHIRLMQMQAAMLYIKYYRENRLGELGIPSDQVAFIFCGDFNSQPERGVFKFMTEQFIPNDYVDFESNEQQAIRGLSLEHSYNMASAYDGPLYTNYTVDFKGVLDYIFFETDTLKTIQTVPIPDESILSMEMALPSAYFPSDHIALIADLEYL